MITLLELNDRKLKVEYTVLNKDLIAFGNAFGVVSNEIELIRVYMAIGSKFVDVTDKFEGALKKQLIEALNVIYIETIGL